MAHDIVIRGGQIVDGTGREPVPGDLAIDGGVITAVGRVESGGRREIDAQGQLVTPGFVDIHTHLDAQIGWDPACTPVSWHGVTTALLGNCDVTFAPCKPSDRTATRGDRRERGAQLTRSKTARRPCDTAGMGIDTRSA